jgi:hypothetical protein
MYVYFGFTVPSKAYNQVISFIILFRIVIIIIRCCPQHQIFFRAPQCEKIVAVVTYNTDFCSALQATMRKNALISVHVCFLSC